MDRLDGLRILVVEDDALIAASVCGALEGLGAGIVGPAGNVEAALALLEASDVDGAVLDVNLGSDLVYPVADRLIGGQVPFIFSTGFPVSAMPIAYWHLPRQDKPYGGRELATRLAAMCCMSAKVSYPPFLGPDPSLEQRRALA